MKLSAVILAKNEEKLIQKAIASVTFCDEIIVIDDFSTDKTIHLAKEAGAVVYEHELKGDFAAARNFGVQKSRGEWILFLDSDETVRGDLATEIIETVNKKNLTKVSYYIKRRDFWWSTELKHGEVHKARRKGLIRLIKKHSGIWVHPVHEVFEARGLVGSLKGHIDHYPHPTVREFLNDINIYSSIRAKELVASGKKVHILSIVFYPFGKFIYSYFIKMGYLDGPAGFAYAFFMSFHSFLVRAKQYQYIHFKAV